MFHIEALSRHTFLILGRRNLSNLLRRERPSFSGVSAYCSSLEACLQPGNTITYDRSCVILRACSAREDNITQCPSATDSSQFAIESNQTPPPVKPTMKCNTIPYPKSRDLLGREFIINDILEAFKNQSSRVASVALWGAGGIGKTQVALEFAHRELQSGTKVILWIDSETPTKVDKSFNDASKALGLVSEAATSTPGQNRHLVLQWLQKTGMTHSLESYLSPRSV